MKMNKKAEGEGWFLILILCFIIGIAMMLSDNSYKSYMRDCKDLYKQEITYETECLNGTLSDFFNDSYNYIPCNKTDNDKLTKFCQDKYTELNPTQTKE
jgi:Ca2+-dependent lipid-binding protein